MSSANGTLAWDGTISSSHFYNSACNFVQRWKTINFSFPPWSWIPCQNLRLSNSDKSEGYLSLEKICLLKPHKSELEKGHCLKEIETASCNSEEFLDDDATLVPMPNDHQEVHFYDFHILHSASYRVPVLYFRAYCSDGRLLTFEEVEKDLPSQTSNALLDSKWTFITHEEHPYLKRPWYKLHPCGTSEWMKLLFNSDASSWCDNGGIPIEGYIASWLSVVGQVVGFRIPIEMLKDATHL